MFTCFISTETSSDDESPKSKFFFFSNQFPVILTNLDPNLKYFYERDVNHIYFLSRPMMQQQKVDSSKGTQLTLTLMISNLLWLEFYKLNSAQLNVTRMLIVIKILINPGEFFVEHSFVQVVRIRLKCFLDCDTSMGIVDLSIVLVKPLLVIFQFHLYGTLN